MQVDRYSLLRYSVNTADQTTEITDDHFNVLDAIAGPALIVRVLDNYFETVHARLSGAIALPETVSMVTKLYSVVVGSVEVYADELFDDAFAAKASAGKIVWFDDTVETVLMSRSTAGQKIHFTDYYDAVFLVMIEGGKDLVFDELHTTSLESTAGGSKVDIYTMTFALTLPAGGELLINTEDYEVYIGTVNALEYQHGDWLTIDRDTLSLTIESGTGGSISGNLAYTERYL